MKQPISEEPGDSSSRLYERPLSVVPCRSVPPQPLQCGPAPRQHDRDNEKPSTQCQTTQEVPRGEVHRLSRRSPELQCQSCPRLHEPEPQVRDERSLRLTDGRGRSHSVNEGEDHVVTGDDAINNNEGSDRHCRGPREPEGP